MPSNHLLLSVAQLVAYVLALCGCLENGLVGYVSACSNLVLALVDLGQGVCRSGCCLFGLGVDCLSAWLGFA